MDEAKAKQVYRKIDDHISAMNCRRIAMDTTREDEFIADCKIIHARAKELAEYLESVMV